MRSALAPLGFEPVHVNEVDYPQFGWAALTGRMKADRAHGRHPTGTGHVRQISVCLACYRVGRYSGPSHIERPLAFGRVSFVPNSRAIRRTSTSIRICITSKWATGGAFSPASNVRPNSSGSTPHSDHA